MSLASQFRHQADEGELASAGFAIVQFQQTDQLARRSLDREDVHLGVVDDRT